MYTNFYAIFNIASSCNSRYLCVRTDKLLYVALIIASFMQKQKLESFAHA